MSTIAKRGQAQQLLIYVRSSLWFVPALIILGAIALAIGLVELDRHVDQDLHHWWPGMFGSEAEGARGMLSAIATSMATVAGVVFSITIVALTLASSQYTSRVLRNFMRDRANQVVLGVFVGVYIYCLLVLRTVNGGSTTFVPSVAVLCALVLAIFASAVFIFFIHHISATIQASEMAAAITRETLVAIDRLFPEEVGTEANQTTTLKIPANITWQAISALNMGYVQSVDAEALLSFARKHNTIVRMECGIGDFIGPDRALASLATERAPDASMVKDLNRIYAIDSYRTIGQDAAFGIRQLVDISLKALSPGINDTTTAVTCIEHISVLLARCAQRKMAAPHRFDGGMLRVIAQRPDFSFLVSLAFNQIIENAEGNTEIMLRMLAAIAQIADATRDSVRIAALKGQVDDIDEVARRSAKSGNALRQIEGSLNRVRLLLDQQEPALRFH